jgi:uncharacterized membrane protein YkoI
MRGDKNPRTSRGLNASPAAGSNLKMKMIIFSRSLLLGGMFAIVSAALAAEPGEATLMKQAKITKAQAEQVALAQVPHGRVKTAEIENEKGHLVWSFDISRPNTKDITEILVDARSGKIVSKQTETVRDQAAEAAADKRAR